MPPRAASLTPKAVGDLLEQRVASLLRLTGAWPVRTDVRLRDAHGHLSQVDVVYGWLRPTYVECKHYAPGNSVSLAEVAKFKEVLALNGLPVSRGLFITTSSYVPRARMTGLRTLDGGELAAWERSARRAAAGRARLRAVGLTAALLAATLQWAPALAQAAGATQFMPGAPLGDALALAHGGWVRGSRAASQALGGWLEGAVSEARRQAAGWPGSGGGGGSGWGGR